MEGFGKPAAEALRVSSIIWLGCKAHFFLRKGEVI